MVIIKYLGHSAFLISGEAFSVVTDPFSGIGYEMEKVKADYCTVSHGHYDHCAIGNVDAGKVLSGDNCDNAAFSAFKTFHDDKLGALRGENLVFSFLLDGVRFCHLGDLGEEFSIETAREIGSPDVLFVPVGGNYTINAETAERFVREVNPKIVIPMHYKTPRSNVDISGNEDFCARFNRVIKKPAQFKLSFSELNELNGLTVFLPDSSAF